MACLFPWLVCTLDRYLNGAALPLSLDNYGPRPVVDYIVPLTSMVPMSLLVGQGVVYNGTAARNRTAAFTGYIGECMTCSTCWQVGGMSNPL